MSQRAQQVPPGPPGLAWLSEEPSHDGFDWDMRTPRAQPCPVPSISYLLQGFPSPLCLISTYSCLFSCPFLASPCPQDKRFLCPLQPHPLPPPLCPGAGLSSHTPSHHSAPWPSWAPTEVARATTEVRCWRGETLPPPLHRHVLPAEPI